ncbi:MAG: alpha amylase C-terminal domain-containing protein [Candidatus Saccharimonas sp.]|nr:alpha amylase C-terminal domain-containing protein [Planctomycetaceae bacterium]
MGAMPHKSGVAFRVWAPHADTVSVTGSFNDWSSDADLMTREGEGYWYADLSSAAIGDEYRYRIVHGDQQLLRIDPYARQVTNSVGNAVVHEPHFDWDGDDFHLPPINEMVIYELHLGTFHDQEDGKSDRFAEAIQKLGHLQRLGVNVIEVMPLAEFAGYSSWGYNPACVFAVENSYGGPAGFKRFVKAAHRAGMGVILDVVYNHFGPSDLDLWQFDGWSENGNGGIYFYGDWRAETPWGATRPDYGRKEVRQFIRDNALMWLEEYHVDGLRFDMTLFMRNVRGDGDPGGDLPDAWSLVQWINREVKQRYPGRITIAEDLQNNDRMTKPEDQGGAAFTAQWDAQFVHPIRAAIITPNDEHRSLDSVRGAIGAHYNGDPFQRVIYSESHDEVANGKFRIPSEIDSQDSNNWFAQKRSTLAAAFVLTAPGIPMLFQGQEFLEDGSFQDSVRIDWPKSDEFSGLMEMYRDMIQLRLNRSGCTRGLSGSGLNVFHQNQPNNVIAYHRWYEGGPGDDVVVVANLSRMAHQNYKLGFPAPGTWRLRLNSDSNGYSPIFANQICSDVVAGTERRDDPPDANAIERDGFPAAGTISIGSYSVLVFSQDKPH